VISCKEIWDALDRLKECVSTDAGMCIATQCLYPSFEPVRVYVVKIGDSYRVHDGGGAARSCWEHARDGGTVQRALTRQVGKFGIELNEERLGCDAINIDWLSSAILAVANASAAAAHSALEHTVAAAEGALRDRIYSVLASIIAESKIAKSLEVVGASGKSHKFDFGVTLSTERMLLVDAVTPHHVSIASKYVAFSDASKVEEMRLDKFAVFDKPLAQDDISLLQQVADIVPFQSLRTGIERARLH